MILLTPLPNVRDMGGVSALLLVRGSPVRTAVPRLLLGRRGRPVARDRREAGAHAIARGDERAGLAERHDDIGARAELDHAELLPGAQGHAGLDPAADAARQQPGDLDDDERA